MNKNKLKMNTNRKTAIIMGSLFITVIVSWSIGFWLIEDVLKKPDYLTIIYPNKIRLFIGVIFELIDVAAIISIVVFMFPIIKKYSEKMALWFVCFRILECVMLIVAIISSLTLITLSREYLIAGISNTSYFQTLGTLFVTLRDNWVNLVLPFFYSFAAVVFYYFLYRSRLVPRFISALGIIASVLILAGIPLDFIEFKPGAFVGILGGMSEILLGFWLIVNGFNPVAIVSLSAKTESNEIK